MESVLEEGFHLNCLAFISFYFTFQAFHQSNHPKFASCSMIIEEDGHLGFELTRMKEVKMILEVDEVKTQWTGCTHEP